MLPNSQYSPRYPDQFADDLQCPYYGEPGRQTHIIAGGHVESQVTALIGRLGLIVELFKYIIYAYHQCTRMC